jgi:ketosteroid isomerase-like protein
MKRFALLIGMLCVLSCGCVEVCTDEDGTHVPTELTTVIDAFYTAIENADSTRGVMFSDSALMLPNHWTMSKGDAVRRSAKGSKAWEFKIKDRVVVDMDISDDIAYTVNSYYYTWHAAGSEPQWHKTKNVHIWKKNDEGVWKLHVDIWNSDVPMTKFTEE